MPLPKSSISLSIASERPFDLGDAVADFADGADVLFGDAGFEAGDLGFDFLQQCTHKILLKAFPQRGQARLDAAVIDIAAHLMRTPPSSAGFCVKIKFNPPP
jgi:hypothetical protein